MTKTVNPRAVERRAVLRGTIALAGAAVVLPSFTALGGCSSVPPSLASKMPLLAALADRIIPATETPGALAAGVPDYIAAVFEQHFTADQKRAFFEGLEALEAHASEHGASAFAALAQSQQDELLASLISTADENPAKSTFLNVRDLTIFGFYTSEVAKQELAYEELPGRYDGCVPLADIGSAWLERGV